MDVDLVPESEPIWELWGVPGDAPGPSSAEWISGQQVVADYPLMYGSMRRLLYVGDPALPADVDDAAVETMRIEQGQPLMGVDLDEKTIPQEGVDVAAAVDFGKGCYLGQELVARIDSRGRVNRRLAGLVLTGEQVPSPGPVANVDGDEVGALTSVAWSEKLQASIGLVMLRREVAIGDRVFVQGVPGTAVSLPMV